MSTPTANELRSKAARAREEGRERAAARYEREADIRERMERITAREEERHIQVAKCKYRVTLNYNERGEWYANAHGRGDIMPAAYVSGLPSLDTALKAIRDKLYANDGGS